MKTRIAFIVMLLMFCISPSQAASGERSWSQPMTNEDGSPLTDLAGWNAYCSATPNIDPLDPGTYSLVVFVAVGTTTDLGLDANGDPRHAKVIDCVGIDEPYMVLTSLDDKSPPNMSGASNEIHCTDTVAPAPPGGFSCRREL